MTQSKMTGIDDSIEKSARARVAWKKWRARYKLRRDKTFVQLIDRRKESFHS